MSAPFVGREVRVIGVNARPELNGQVGFAESFNHDTVRYIVTLGSSETIALRPANLEAVTNNNNDNNNNNNNNNNDNAGGGTGDANYFGDNNAAPGGGGFAGLDPKLLAVAVLAMLVGVIGVPIVLAVVVVGAAYILVSTNVGGGALERVAALIHQKTGIIVSANQAAASVLGIIGLVYYFLIARSSSYPMSQGQGPGYGYGGGGFGGGLDFYWIMGVLFLSSTLWRMGGGGQPNGWSFDQLWHSLSNMDIWRGMMLMNLVQQVLGGGGRRGGYGRRW